MKSASYLAKGVFLGLFAVLAACGGGGGGDNAKAPAAETSAPASSTEVPIAFEKLGSISAWASGSSPDAPPQDEATHSFVVRSDAQLQSAWQHFMYSDYEGNKHVSEKPVVDFSQSMLVGVSVLGIEWCSSDSGSVVFGITQVLESENRITVRYGWRPDSPPSQELWGCTAEVPSKQVLVDFVKIKASSKPIDFVFDGVGSYQNGKLVVSDNSLVNPNGTIREIPFESIQNIDPVGSIISGPDLPTTYVADTADKWQSIWSHQFHTYDYQGNLASPFVPTVDFSTTKVVGVTTWSGACSIGFYINRVVEDDKHIVVEFEETFTEGEGEIFACTADVTYYKMFVKIKPSNKPVQFRGVKPDVLIEGEGTW